LDKDEEIAVLGAGIIGLTTAYLLVSLGYKANVYA
jgi:glycine/D-amino acid oxidase-like deaminating enzyme